MGRSESGTTWLTAGDYERLRRATETYREDLVLRLGAEVGLKPVEMSQLKPAHITRRTHRGTDLYLLTVPADGRDAHLPSDVEHDIRKYVRANDTGETERVLPVTPRRLQMLVSSIGERAAEKTSHEGLADISTRDLRRYFARTLLSDGVHPSVVMSIGGWDRIESLAPLLDDPDEDTILDAFSPEPDESNGHSDRGGTDRLQQVVETVRSVGSALPSVSTRSEVEQTVCDRFSDSEHYQFAWIESDENDARVSLAAAAGLDEASLEAVRQSLSSRGTDYAERACHNRAVQTTTAVDLPTGTANGAVTIVPLLHGETAYGALYLALDRANVTDSEKDVLLTLGRHIGQAITAVERRKLLLADTVVQLEFQCSDDDDLLVRLSADLGCTVRLRGVVPIEEQSLLCFLTVRGVTTDAVFDELVTAAEVENIRLIRDRGEESLLEVALSAGSTITTLTSYDGTVSRFVAEDGVARFASEFSNETPLRDVMADLTDAYPDTELVAKHEVERPARNTADFRESLATRLTDKQQSVLRAAYLAGYFEWPRGSTAEDLADSIDISSPTLHQHLRTAQQKLLTSFFDDDEPETEPRP
ncbi:bacterio-opsin activator (plasmid) [Haloferax mediterranei ATCC 33500]|uniref:Bacterio-opsin activator n=1 Tax=Haloferax mediterranei (strain ATCC 33500 / DSM 1411 / JCM 8866 / NBRC 14739 / NCIMB 2177 / R-4) TaxID=523841 RepID=I3R9Q4_HALMT|nr:bacterio-opsin activator domain-containing protein [Haloferax mediterranei]AFK20964.1 bacterio-opsin activator-like protein [Haloferax mediterranei ATCC 33500]AHZ24172.1 bacterio-opsin activator [Haloferax mediterranei ATCC 33500]EMA05249.1 bacterio-opsin activator-like protein [Haloferax mediterranei ATCC 33500]MDX5989947.1 bacterio-opsin activator domain-containing protein [Haloferax mediterranei ATCC 33500]QCQ77135.1 bacterio-opsin activator [Haloferax mediterranei ATCC 33500]